MIMTRRNQKILIYVNRSSNQWIVRDSDGNYWVIPVVDDPWEHRQPFERTEDSQLEAVPGHYKSLLGLPF